MKPRLPIRSIFRTSVAGGGGTLGSGDCQLTVSVPFEFAAMVVDRAVA